MEKEELISRIKKWLELEQSISSLSNQLRELRKQKRMMNLDLVEIMKTNEIDCIDCNSGQQIKYTRNSVKKTINKTYLQDILTKYCSENNMEESDKICNYILDNRVTEIKENIKLKKKK